MPTQRRPGRVARGGEVAVVVVEPRRPAELCRVSDGGGLKADFAKRGPETTVN